MATPEYLPMSPEERGALERRAASEATSGRLILGVHFILLAAMSWLAHSFSRPQARGPLLVAAVVGVSGAGWLVYIRLLAARIREDLSSGLTAAARVRLTRKFIVQGKASVAHYLSLDPPLPNRKTLVSASVYGRVADGDWLDVRYFPGSKIVVRVEKA